MIGGGINLSAVRCVQELDRVNWIAGLRIGRLAVAGRADENAEAVVGLEPARVRSNANPVVVFAVGRQAGQDEPFARVATLALGRLLAAGHLPQLAGPDHLAPPVFDKKIEVLCRPRVFRLLVLVPGQGDSDGIVVEQVAEAQGAGVALGTEAQVATVQNLNRPAIDASPLVAGGVDPDDAGGDGTLNNAINRPAAVAVAAA